MDLILLEPGDQSIFWEKNSFTTGGSLINPNAPNVSAPWNTSAFTKNSCIELVSIHQGMKQQITTDVSNSARTSGRPVVTEFTCVKYVDKLSVKFYDYCLRAATLGKGPTNPTMIYICRNSGDVLLNLMTFALKDTLISEIQMQSHPNDMPTEQFKLSFTEVTWTFTVQNNDMSAGGNITTGWSLARNAPIGGKFTGG